MHDPFFRMFIRRETIQTIADVFEGTEEENEGIAYKYFRDAKTSTINTRRADNWSSAREVNLPKCDKWDPSYPWKTAENMWMFQRYLHGKESKKDMNDSLSFRFDEHPDMFPHNADLLLKWSDVVFDKEDLKVCLDQFNSLNANKGCYRSFLEQCKLLARCPVLMFAFLFFTHRTTRLIFFFTKK